MEVQAVAEVRGVGVVARRVFGPLGRRRASQVRDSRPHRTVVRIGQHLFCPGTEDEQRGRDGESHLP